MEEHVTISKGNSKMGAIPSVSFPPIITCAACECHKKCYAVKVTKYSKTAKQSYEKNWRIYNEDRDKFWSEVAKAIKMSTAFRFFVSGDIPDLNFLSRMCDIAEKNPQCQILCFTKKWKLVNTYIEAVDLPPENLHLILSYWRNFEVHNNFNLPECHVIFKDGYTTAPDGKNYLCSGNCTECFCETKGCFGLKHGERVLIKEH